MVNVMYRDRCHSEEDLAEWDALLADDAEIEEVVPRRRDLTGRRQAAAALGGEVVVT